MSEVDAGVNMPDMDPATPPADGSPSATESTSTEPTGNPSANDQHGGMSDPSAPGQNNDPAPPQEPKPNEWLGAPEKGYTADGFDLPEGYEVDDTTAEGLAGVCKDLGLSQKAFATIVNRMTPVLEQAQREQLATIKQNNLKAFAADKELGGSRAKATIAQAKVAYEKYCPDDCRQILNQLGLDAHPGMIKMFYRLSQMLSDDMTPRSSGSVQNGYDLAKFFNNSKMN